MVSDNQFCGELEILERCLNRCSGPTPTAAAVTAANQLTARESLRFDVTNAVSPETDKYELCVSYTIDAQ